MTDVRNFRSPLPGSGVPLHYLALAFVPVQRTAVTRQRAKAINDSYRQLKSAIVSDLEIILLLIESILTKLQFL